MFLWDILFPRRCLGCGRLGVYVCLDCSRALKPVINQACLYCGRPSPWGLTHPACKRENGVDGRISLYYYGGVLRKIIAGIKYRLVRDAFSDLAFLISRQASFLTEFFRNTEGVVLHPIPQARGRNNERGFSQTLIISRIFSSLFPLRLIDVLTKNKETPPQATLAGHRLRKGNVKGVFSVRKGGQLPEKIMLVDDVVTSGETVKEAARVLKAAGVKKVYVLSVAKG